MKRYFDFPTDRIVCQLDIIDDSQAATADIEAFRKHFKKEDAREISNSEYKRLQVLYCDK